MEQNEYVKEVISLGNKQNNAKHILLCGDKKYIQYVGVTLTSILIANPQEVFVFYIFCDAVSEEDLEKLERTAKKFAIEINIHILNVDVIKQFSEDMAGNDHISVAAYFRFIAFGALKGITDKVLYLDSDICVVDNNLIDFWKVNLQDKIAIVIGKPDGDSTQKRLHVKQAFNSGVIFVDIDKWNQEDLTHKCIKKACERVWPFLDQDVLNMMLDGKFISFDKRYNYEFSLSHFIDHVAVPSKVPFNKNDATIIHYIGASKPWHTWIQCCQISKIYIEIKAKSEWKDMPLISPAEMKKQKYKYYHKAARVTKKEGKYIDCLKNYVYYAVNKVRDKI